MEVNDAMSRMLYLVNGENVDIDKVSGGSTLSTNISYTLPSTSMVVYPGQSFDIGTQVSEKLLSHLNYTLELRPTATYIKAKTGGICYIPNNEQVVNSVISKNGKTSEVPFAVPDNKLDLQSMSLSPAIYPLVKQGLDTPFVLQGGLNYVENIAIGYFLTYKSVGQEVYDTETSQFYLEVLTTSDGSTINRELIKLGDITLTVTSSGTNFKVTNTSGVENTGYSGYAGYCSLSLLRPSNTQILHVGVTL